MPKCINPIRVKNEKFPEESSIKYFDFACGKCFNCLSNRRDSWLYRLLHESLDSFASYFVTLTLDDEHYDGNVHKSHLQKFFKTIRNVLPSFKYYAIGEFGSITKRGHYHAIIFFKSPVYFESYHYGFNISEIIDRFWKLGNILCVPANASCLNYVLHYHVRPKFPFGKRDREHKTFCLFSKNLGLSSLFDKDGNIKKDIEYMLTSTPNRIVSDFLGRTFVLPRYFVKKAKENGLPVYSDDRPCTDVNKIFSTDFSVDYISRANSMLKIIDPTLQFDVNGLPVNLSDKAYLSFLNDIKDISNRKFNKYDYQNPNSI